MYNETVSKRSLILRVVVLVLALAGTVGLWGHTVTAQERSPGAADASVVRLSVEDALAKARDESFPVRSSQAAERLTRAKKRQSLAVFLPQVTLSEQGLATTDPVNAFGFTLQQERFTQADFAVDALNDPDRVDHFVTQAEVRQPLLNLDGIYERRAAADAVRAATKTTEWTQSRVAFQVKKGYYGLLLAQRRVAVLDSSLSAARANRDQAQDLYEQGMINRADQLAAEVRVSELESERTDAAADRRTAADRLRFLIGIDEDVQIVPTDSLALERPDLAPISLPEVNERRSDMQALRYRADAAEKNVRSRWMAFVPTLNARGTTGWYDDSPFGTRGQSWTVGVSLSWSLFDGYKQIGEAQQAEAEQQRAEVALQEQALENEVEIEATRRDILAARDRMEQAREAVEQAEESLRIRSDRYAEGMARTTDLLQAEAALASRRLAHLNALYDHNVAVYRLELLTERDLTVD